MTDNNGKYLFTNLTAGTYFVKLTGVGVPTGLVSSTGGGVANNSTTGTYEPSTTTADNRDHGTQMGAMVMSSAVVLPAATVDTTVDFGLYKPVYPKDTFFVSLPIDSVTTKFCPTANDLRDVKTVTVNVCNANGVTNYGTYTTDAAGCITYTAGHLPIVKGDTICLIATDSLGRKDTTVVIITITPKSALGNLVWNDNDCRVFTT